MQESLITAAARPVGFETAGLDRFAKFKAGFDRWIHSSSQTVTGLPANSYIVSGITDAFNQTYALYDRIGVFPGEYGYHELVLGSRVTTDLASADVIIISHPFSANGNCAHSMLAHADSFNKPIFVDCAFFGICINQSFDFSAYKNIHSVCFSLSKSFGTGLHRVGLLYTRDPLPVTVYETWDYPLLSSAEYHYGLLRTRSPDDQPRQLRSAQLAICAQLGVEPSDTVIFGLDYSERWAHMRRGSVNRLCISQLLQKMLQNSG